MDNIKFVKKVGFFWFQMIMAVENLSFYNWLKKDIGASAEKFREAFRDEIQNIPQRVVSSKMLREFITIDTRVKEEIFKRAFLEYFREKLNLDIGEEQNRNGDETL